MARPPVLALCALLLAGLLGACSPPHTPAEVTSAWLDSLADDNPDAALSMSSAAHRQRHDAAELRAAVAGLDDNARQRLRTPATSPTVRTARWTTPGGTLQFEHRGGDRWVLVGALPRFDRQDTPEQTLLTMRRAIRQGDFELLLAVAPGSEAETLTAAQLAARFDDSAFRERTLTALDALIEQGEGEPRGSGRWFVRAGRYRAELALESERWRLIDLR